MTSLLSRVLAVVRAWTGLNDPADNHLHASHGWLLRAPAEVRARTLVLALAARRSAASLIPGKRA